MPLRLHNESMFGGYCVKTAKQKAFIFFGDKRKDFWEKTETSYKLIHNLGEKKI